MTNALMRQRMGVGAKRGAVIRIATIPAPIGGLNARDSIAEMAATDAVALDNFVPGTTNVTLRPGYRTYATGLGGAVESLLPYRSGAANKMFAAAGSNIYDVTGFGAVGDPVVTGLTGARFQYVNFGTPGGQFLVAVNGADMMRVYDGTQWIAEGLGEGATISSITFSGTTATVTTASPHGLAAFNNVTVSGAVPADYNVTAAAITVLSDTTFSYEMATTPATDATEAGTYSFGPSVTFQGRPTLTTASMVSINAFGQRLWLIEQNSFRIWYLGIQSIAGEATLLDMSSLFRLGGALASMITWTVAGTTTTTQYAVFISTEGEVIMYGGYDPANAATWEQVGQARIGRPVGRRFWTRVGTDVVLISEDGFVPLSEVLQLDRKNNADAVSNKIVKAASSAVAAYGRNFGWQVALFPSGDRLIVNVPQIEDQVSYQFVMNTITGAWCRYIGINAIVWESTQENIFFGGVGKVYQAEYGADDDGASIRGAMMPAFNYFGDKAANKRFTQVRPIIEAPAAVTVNIDLTTNFDQFTQPSTPALISGAGSAPWDTTPWDRIGWGTEVRVGYAWQWAGGIGFCATARIQANLKGVALAIDAISYSYEMGGIY